MRSRRTFLTDTCRGFRCGCDLSLIRQEITTCWKNAGGDFLAPVQPSSRLSGGLSPKLWSKRRKARTSVAWYFLANGTASKMKPEGIWCNSGDRESYLSLPWRSWRFPLQLGDSALPEARDRLSVWLHWSAVVWKSNVSHKMHNASLAVENSLGVVLHSAQRDSHLLLRF